MNTTYTVITSFFKRFRKYTLTTPVFLLYKHKIIVPAAPVAFRPFAAAACSILPHPGTFFHCKSRPNFFRHLPGRDFANGYASVILRFFPPSAWPGYSLSGTQPSICPSAAFLYFITATFAFHSSFLIHQAEFLEVIWNSFD